MAAAAARRIQTAVLRRSAAAARSSPAALPLLSASPRKEVCKVFGLPQPSYLRLQKSPMCTSPASEKDMAIAKAVDSGSLKELELRVLKVEVADRFYRNFIWKIMGPFLGVGIFMSISSAMDVMHGVSRLKQRQRDIDDDLAKLEKRIALLESEEDEKGLPTSVTLDGVHSFPLQ